MSTKEGSREAPVGYVECSRKCGRWTDGGLCWACFWKGHATAAEQANLSAAANGNPDWTPATPPTGDPAATPITAMCRCGHTNGKHLDADGLGACDVFVQPGELCPCEAFVLAPRPTPDNGGDRR